MLDILVLASLLLRDPEVLPRYHNYTPAPERLGTFSTAYAIDSFTEFFLDDERVFGFKSLPEGAKLVGVNLGKGRVRRMYFKSLEP